MCRILHSFLNTYANVFLYLQCYKIFFLRFYICNNKNMFSSFINIFSDIFLALCFVFSIFCDNKILHVLSL